MQGIAFLHRNRSSLVLWIAAGLAGGVAAFVSRPSDIGASETALALCIVGAGILPTILHARTEDHPPISIFAIFALFHAVTFGLPTLLADFLWPTSTMDTIGAGWSTPHIYRNYLSDRAALFRFEALALTLAGLLLATGGYLGAGWFLRPRLFTFKIPWNGANGALIFLLWILLLGHISFVALPAVRQIPSAGQLLGPIGYLSFGMFYLLWRSSRISNLHAAFIACLFFFNLFGLAKGGLLTPFMLYVLFFALLLIRLGNWKFLIVGVVAFLIVASAYQTVSKFRSQIYIASPSGEHQALGPLDRALLLANLYMQAVKNPSSPTGIVTSLRTAGRRLALISLFSHVVDKTPETVPYWNGETYKPLFSSFIPRLVWPSKPEEKLGRDFGLRYGFIATEDQHTSVNLPWLIESYANFGLAGVTFGMALIGIFFALLERVFNRAEMTDIEWVTGLVILFPLVYAESNFSVMCGSLLPLALALWVFFNLGLRLKRRADSGNAI